MKELLEKVAIITGASSGIGKQVALDMAVAGAKVVLAARNRLALEEIERAIWDTGGEAMAVPTDVTSQEDVKRLVQAALGQWGRIDILVSNAGQYIRADLETLTIDLIEKSMAVNFFGGVYAILEVLPVMLAQGDGHIILVTSLDAKVFLPLDAPYVAAKCAMSGFANVLRQELHGSGVGVTIMYPGRIDTPLLDDVELPSISPKKSPKIVSRAILKSIRHRPAEVMPFPDKLLYYLRVISPALSDWVARQLRLQGWESS